MLRVNVPDAWVKKAGIVGFSFFLVKGLLWVLVPWFVYYVGFF